MFESVASDSAQESDFDPSRTEARPPPIVVLSDRTLVRELLVDFLRGHGFPHAAGVRSSASLERALAQQTRGLLLVDCGEEREDAREVLRSVRKQRPHVTLVGIGTPLELAANAGDADGWIELSDPSRRLAEVAFAVARAPRGPVQLPASPRLARLFQTWQTLTTRQRQVLALLGCGVSNHKLGAALGLSERAVKAHVSALLDKFKADSRTELALIACHARLHATNAKFPFSPT